MLEDFRLRVFVTVAECRSFTKAAAKLNISQPAVSQHILELEKSLGTKLFERLKGETVLTPAGSVLERYSYAILDRYNRVEQELMRFPDRTVKVAASEEVFGYVTGTLLGNFLELHPEIDWRHTFMEDCDLKITLAASGKEKRMMELSYHPSSAFASTRLWTVLSQILEPALQ